MSNLYKFDVREWLVPPVLLPIRFNTLSFRELSPRA